MVDKLLKKAILEKLIKPIFKDIGSGFTMRRPKGTQHIKGQEESDKFKEDYLNQGDIAVKNYIDVSVDHSQKKSVNKSKQDSKEITVDLKRDKAIEVTRSKYENKVLEDIRDTLDRIRENTKPESFKEKTRKRKEEESDDKAMQELISTLKDKEKDNINISSDGGSLLGDLLDGSSSDIDLDRSTKKGNRAKGGILNKAKGFMKGGINKASGLISKGVGVAGTLAMANPLALSALAAGAVAYGGYKIWDSVRGEDEDKRVFDYLAEIGVIDHDIIGNSEILDWGAIRALNEDTLSKLIGYDDFSDDDTDKLKNILAEKQEDKKIKKNIDLKDKKLKTKKTILSEEMQEAYGNSVNIKEKIEQHKKELMQDKTINFAKMSESEQHDILVKKSFLEARRYKNKQNIKNNLSVKLSDFKKGARVVVSGGSIESDIKSPNTLSQFKEIDTIKELNNIQLDNQRDRLSNSGNYKKMLANSRQLARDDIRVKSIKQISTKVDDIRGIKKAKETINYNQFKDIQDRTSNKLVTQKQTIPDSVENNHNTITTINKSDNNSEDIKELISILKKERTTIPTPPNKVVLNTGNQFKKIDDTTLLLVSNEE